MATHREQRRCREEMPHFGRGAGLASSHKWPHVDAQLTVHKIAGTLYSTTLGHGDMPIPILIRKIFQLPPAEHKKKTLSSPTLGRPLASKAAREAAAPGNSISCKCRVARSKPTISSSLQMSI